MDRPVKLNPELAAVEIGARPNWLRAPVLAACVAALGIVLMYWATAASIVAIWQRSETFAHGFLVVPLCLWLVWRQRDALASLPAKPWWPGLIAVFFAGALWLVSSAALVLGVKQFALAFMIQAAIVTVVGTNVARALLFPLAFLLFAIPAGEFLVPTLIDWTADFAESALRWSGVPLYREANHFIIPTGTWSIVEACSGIRYLIASLMVGTIYAALSYRSAIRRAAFVLASILVPIVANWLRAYMIIMIGHLSNNRLALGVDHLIYGWVFFGVVIVLLFWVGSFWRETEPAVRPNPAIALSAGATEVRPSGRRPLFVAAIAALGIAGGWAVAIEAIVPPRAGAGIPNLSALTGENGWTVSDSPLSNWKPHYSGFTSDFGQTFRKDGHDVGVYLAYYREQEKGRDAVTSGNVLVRRDDLSWRQVAQGSEQIEWAGKAVSTYRAELSSQRVGLEVFRLYWVSGWVTSSEYVAKAMTAWSVLSGRGDASAIIVMYTPKSERGDAARAMLRSFASEMSPAIERVLAASRGAGR